MVVVRENWQLKLPHKKEAWQESPKCCSVPFLSNEGAGSNSTDIVRE